MDVFTPMNCVLTTISATGITDHSTKGSGPLDN